MIWEKDLSLKSMRASPHCFCKSQEVASQVAPILQGLGQMDVPSPVQEESGTPTSRGTGTTSSSSNRRPETSDEMSRFSPMGAAVRHSQISGLTPVQESSFEAVSSSNAEGQGSVGASNTFLRPPGLAGPSNNFRCSIEVTHAVPLSA